MSLIQLVLIFISLVVAILYFKVSLHRIDLRSVSIMFTQSKAIATNLLKRFAKLLELVL